MFSWAHLFAQAQMILTEHYLSVFFLSRVGQKGQERRLKM
jgi:hypothetical protein